MSPAFTLAAALLAALFGAQVVAARRRSRLSWTAVTIIVRIVAVVLATERVDSDRATSPSLPARLPMNRHGPARALDLGR